MIFWEGKEFQWNPWKNEWLKLHRGIAFEEIVARATSGGLIDIIDHWNPGKYPGQKVLVVAVDGYACLVPFARTPTGLFLKTIIPSRRHTKRYLGGGPTK